jgi:hypothetical protein
MIEVAGRLQDRLREVVKARRCHHRSLRPSRLSGGAARSSQVKRAARGTTKRRSRRSEGSWPARASWYASPREIPSSCRRGHLEPFALCEPLIE